MQKDFGPVVNFRAGKILEQLTNGAYKSLIVSERLIPSVANGNRGDIKSASSFSSATVDQIYLSLRIAISGMLSDQPLPIFLDEAFAQYDDDRMKTALSFFSRHTGAEEHSQVIIFTCHDRVLRAAGALEPEPVIVRL